MTYERAQSSLVTQMGHLRGFGVEAPAAASFFFDRCLLVPVDVNLDGGDLVWSPAPGFGKSPDVDGVLDEFIRLADGSPDRLLAFARRWGALNICAHSLPASHSVYSSGWVELDSAPRGGGNSGRCRAISDGNGLRREPLSAWRVYAWEARCILSIAADLQMKQPTHEADWEASPWHRLFADWRPGPNLSDTGALLPSIAWKPPWLMSDPHEWLATWVRRWLRLGGVVPWMRYDGQAQAFMLFQGYASPIDRAGGLFAALALGLATALMRNITRCDECGTPYSQERRPKRNQSHYCLLCRQGYLASKRSSYRRRRAAKAI
ncbi:MAG: hypothetical protein HY331_03135 [Chloroflexi bacterium]|nr:hypothetical protein [Chloroflexota bacterium]